MPKEGFKAITVRKECYDIANKQAKLEGVSIAEIFNKAVDRYVHTRKALEERIKLIIQSLDRLEKDFPS